MNEEALSEERTQLIEAIDWIDKERQRLKRLAEATIRRGGRGSGQRANLMKKESQWLFGQRTRIRERLVHVNVTIKEMRRASNGKPGETFATTFYGVAKEYLGSEVFGTLEEMTRRKCSDGGPPPYAPTPCFYGKDSKSTVLVALKGELEKIRESNGRPARPPEKKHRKRETQADFGIMIGPE
jgi:hypothetical protein